MKRLLFLVLLPSFLLAMQAPRGLEMRDDNEQPDRCLKQIGKAAICCADQTLWCADQTCGCGCFDDQIRGYWSRFPNDDDDDDFVVGCLRNACRRRVGVECGDFCVDRVAPFAVLATYAAMFVASSANAPGILASLMCAFLFETLGFLHLGSRLEKVRDDMRMERRINAGVE